MDCFMDKKMATSVATNFINWLYNGQDTMLVGGDMTKTQAVEWLLVNNMDFAKFMKEHALISPACPPCVCPSPPGCPPPIEKEICEGKKATNIISKIYWID